MLGLVGLAVACFRDEGRPRREPSTSPCRPMGLPIQSGPTVPPTSGGRVDPSPKSHLSNIDAAGTTRRNGPPEASGPSGARVPIEGSRDADPSRTIERRYRPSSDLRL